MTGLHSLISSITTVLSMATWTAIRLQESNTASFLKRENGRQTKLYATVFQNIMLCKMMTILPQYKSCEVLTWVPVPQCLAHTTGQWTCPPRPPFELKHKTWKHGKSRKHLIHSKFTKNRQSCPLPHFTHRYNDRYNGTPRWEKLSI